MGNSSGFRSSYFETCSPYLRHIGFVVGFVLFMIVNNGNILADGTDERKYLEKKYNDL